MPEQNTISIRRAEPADTEAVRQIYAGPKAIWGTLQLPCPSSEVWRKWLTEPNEGIFNLVASVEHEVVGQLTLYTFPNLPRRRHVGQIGMAMRDDWHGKGVGTTWLRAALELADQWLNLRRLELDVYTDNEPAIRLYKKFGFVVEGMLVRFAYRAGQYVDGYAMGRVKPEQR
jgi:putative acetyltransferase